MEAKLFVFAAVAISEVFSACAPTGTKFKNFQKTPKRSIRFKIGVVSKKCPGIDEFYYRWTVQEIPGYKSVKKSSHSSLTIDGYTFPTSKCYVREYLVTVKVSHYPDMTYADQKKGKFHFVPDQMHVEILGGYEKSHPFGENLLIDAKTLSKDLSFLPEEDAFAGNIIRWSFPETFKGFVPPRALVFVVPAKMLKKGKYEFTVTITRTKIPKYTDVAEATQTVEVITGTFPQLNIICMRNCLHPHHLDTTVFGVNCTKNCDDAYYDWHLDPPVQDEQRTDFGDGFDTLIILNGAYKEGTRVKVNVKSGPSSYSIILSFAPKLKKGKCTINPKKGISGVTKFKFKCTGFNSPYGVVIYNIYQILQRKYVLINEESYHDESEVYLTAARKAKIVIEVLDNAYSHAYQKFTVRVKEFRPSENIAIGSAVKKLILATDNTSITSYSIEGFHNEAMQLTVCLLRTIKRIKMDNSTTKDLHKHMAEAMLHIHPGKFAIAYQLVQVLLRLGWYRYDDDSQTGMLMMRATTDATLHLHEMHNHEHDRNIPQNLIENYIYLTLDLISNVLRRSDAVMEILNRPEPLNDYDSFESFLSRKVQIRDDYKKMIKNAFIILQTDCITALFKTFPDEKPKVFENGILTLHTERKFLFQTEMITLTVAQGDGQDTKVFIPFELMEEIAHINSYADFQSAIFWWNPFWWHKKALSVNTHVILFDLFIKCHKVELITTPFYIQFEILSLPMDTKNGTLTDKSLAVYRMEIGPFQKLYIQFKNVPESYTKYAVTYADCFCKEEDFQTPQTKTISRNANSTENSLQIPNDHGAIKIVFICIKKLSPVVSYEMTLTSFSCQYWDLKEEEWSGYGCRVVKAGFEAKKPLICECYHFSIFAGQIEIPLHYQVLPTDVGLTLDFFKNYAMYVVVAAVILLYIISLILAHYRDKSMRKKNIVHKLDDNVPGDRYAYLVVFFTGFFFDAQTTADIGFQLIGEQANSRSHVVKCKGFKLLQRNAQDWFTVYTPAYLGHLKKLKLWTNCKGKSPHWYCERVIIQDLRTGLQYCFTVKKWFSVTWGTRKIYREFRFKSHSQEDPKKIFYTHVERDIKDNHMWISIFERDVQSNFTSKERVSVGFVFVFLTMLANAIFAGVPSGSPTDSIDQSKYFVNFNHIFIFFGAWLAALPLALFIIFVFKNSKPL